jgi:hypothetical protein
MILACSVYIGHAIRGLILKRVVKKGLLSATPLSDVIGVYLESSPAAFHHLL